MSHIQWLPSMELGIPALDAAHREFVTELGQIASVPDAEFPGLMQHLVARLEQDFAEEERLMEEIDFPGLHSHLEQHARVLSSLHHAMSQVMSGDTACGREATALLFDWFQMHVATMDQVLAVAADMAAVERAFPRA